MQSVTVIKLNNTHFPLLSSPILIMSHYTLQIQFITENASFPSFILAATKPNTHEFQTI